MYRLKGSNFTVIAEDENRVELSFTRAWNPSYQNSPPLNIDKRYPEEYKLIWFMFQYLDQFNVKFT